MVISYQVITPLLSLTGWRVAYSNQRSFAMSRNLVSESTTVTVCFGTEISGEKIAALVQQVANSASRRDAHHFRSSGLARTRYVERDDVKDGVKTGGIIIGQTSSRAHEHLLVSPGGKGQAFVLGGIYGAITIYPFQWNGWTDAVGYLDDSPITAMGDFSHAFLYAYSQAITSGAFPAYIKPSSEPEIILGAIDERDRTQPIKVFP